MIGSDARVSVRKVELGAQDDSKVVVISGLAPGDRVVVDGADRLRDGADVFIAASDGAATEGSERGESRFIGKRGRGPAGSRRRQSDHE